MILIQFSHSPSMCKMCGSKIQLSIINYKTQGIDKGIESYKQTDGNRVKERDPNPWSILRTILQS